MYFYDVGNLNLAWLFIEQNYFTVYNTYYYVTISTLYKNTYGVLSTLRFSWFNCIFCLLNIGVFDFAAYFELIFK